MSLGRAVLRAGRRTVPEPSAYADFAPHVVVPEWLWGVLTYGVHETLGATGLSVLAALLSALCAWLVCALCERLADDSEGARDLSLLIATLVIAAALSRLRLRPQAAFLCFLPGLLWLAERYRGAQGRERLRLGMGAVGLSLLWAQTHASFVLAPALFALQTAPLAVSRLRDYLRRDGPTLLAMVATLLSSAHGLRLVPYILDHAGGDASHYVADIVAPSWAGLDPRIDAPLLAIWLLWLVGFMGLLVSRSWRLRQLLLAGFGMLLLATATRFLAAAAVLAAPLAQRGAETLLTHLRAKGPLSRGRATATKTTTTVMAIAGAAAMLAWAAQMVDTRYGPIGRVGLAVDSHPLAAVAWLRSQPAGTRVWNDFAAGGPLGFYLDGRVRTYLDSRTPLHFDDTDFALLREALQHEGALRASLARFGASVAVVERQSQACANFSGPLGWQLVAIDPMHSTFAPPQSAAPLAGLRPCGRDYVDQGCRDPKAITGSLERVSERASPAFVALLRAQQTLACGGSATHALSQLERATPPPRVLSRAHARDSVRALLAAGRMHAALPRLREMAEAGDLGVLGPLSSPSLRDQPAHALLPVLEALFEAMGDGLPPPVRSELARLYALVGDAELARFHGFRAAIRGQAQALPVLQWLAEHHPDEHVRKAAVSWAHTLRAQTNAQQSVPSAIR